MQRYIHLATSITLLKNAIYNVWNCNGRLTLILVVLYSLILLAFESATPIIFGSLLDELGKPIIDVWLGNLIVLTASYLLAKFISALTHIGRQNQTYSLERLISLDLAKQYSSMIISLPRGSIGYTSGEASWRLDNALSTASLLVTTIFLNQIPVGLQICIAGLVIGIKAGAYLLIIMILFVACMFATLVWYFDAQVDGVKKINNSVGAFYGLLTDCISNMDAVKYFSAENYFSKKMNKNSEIIFEAERSMKATLIKIDIIQEAIIFVSWGAISLLSINYVIQNKLTIGQFAMINTYFFMIISPLREAVLNFCEFLQKSEDLDFLRVIKNASDSQVERKYTTKTITFKELRFQKVNFAYDRSPVISNFSYTFKQGQFYAIVGPSGSGKSTLTKLIFRLFEASSGNIYIDDIPIGDVEPEEFRKQISIVPQDPLIFADTILNNLTLGNSFSELELANAIEAAQFSNTLSRLPLGFSTELSEKGGGLSGGELQRLSIARACPTSARMGLKW